ncbi:hypothetical protein QWY84_16170 [Aquisalimonas lutea]|uniref:hypothetical protein n=1 Tax=Aquisalimonas lutea TaxID=1327750 RepID=UPI0025B538B5|nr:hypothetical protein [Aquisalimonas lutea]MDN3519152.1 hypothetical protein [Aquisalimonas lutea]
MMEMRVALGGVGIGIPRMNVGISISHAAIIDFRSDMRSTPFRLVIASDDSLSGFSNSFISSHIITEWFPVNVAKHSWLHRKNRLRGQLADLACYGTYVGSGFVDINFTVYDEYGEPRTLLHTANRATSSGWQFDSTKVRGHLQRMFSDFDLERNIHLREQHNNGIPAREAD